MCTRTPTPTYTKIFLFFNSSSTSAIFQDKAGKCGPPNVFGQQLQQALITGHAIQRCQELRVKSICRTMVTPSSLPSGVLESRYRRIPYLERQCPCDIESTEHVLLQCSFYRDSQTNLILPTVHKYLGCSGQFYTSLLLSDTNSVTTYDTARFCVAKIKIRRVMTGITD